MARYGYMLLDRVDPDVSRQAMQLDTIGGFDRIYIDRQPAGSLDPGRGQRSRLLNKLKPGDVVFAAAVDRFCDNLRDLLKTFRKITDAGAELAILQESLDSRSPGGRVAFRLLESVERLEFRYQSDRKKAGISAARQQGRRIGRPPVSIPPGFREICQSWAAGLINGQEAARRSGLRSTSFYKKAGELGYKVLPRKTKCTDGC
jgi:DNA invertase Pin-like site-specific DNA recombinase